MDLFEISPGELRTRANELEAQRQVHLDAMKKLRVLVFGLDEIWKGGAEKAFVQKFNAGQQAMNDFSKSLSEYITLAKEAADEADRVDNTLLSAVSKI